MVEDHTSLYEAAKNYFQQLILDSTSAYDPVVSAVHPWVSLADNEMLLAPFKEEEIRLILFQMHLNKSP